MYHSSRTTEFRRLLVLPLLTLLLLTGCGSSQGARGTTPVHVELPERLSEQDVGRAIRIYHRLPFDQADRADLRARILAYYDGLSDAIVEAGDYDAAVEHLARMLDLYMPEDLEAGRLDPALEKPARFVRSKGAPRGDEGRVLAALLVLRQLHPDREEYRREYEKVASWGRDARAQIPSFVDRYTQLIEVWEEHSRLTPSPEVLDLLARLHVERRNTLVKALREGERFAFPGFSGEGMGMAPQHLLGRAPFELAAVYLRYGDLDKAIARIESMGAATSIEPRLLRALKDARESTPDGRDSLFELAEVYRTSRPEVAQGLCRMGLRREPSDFRFPQCLARVASNREEFSESTAWYVEAIGLAPEERRLYDEALAQLNEFIARGLYDSNSKGARALASNAEKILDERLKRWPQSEPPIPPEQLQLLVGTLEMNAGNAEGARRAFQASLNARESPDALVQLGLLNERTGRPAEAAELYRRALEQMPDNGPEAALKRAEVLENLGNALRKRGETEEAERTYADALKRWDGAVGSVEGPALAFVQQRRGVLLDRLGRSSESVLAFRQALSAAPGWRETYAGILSHLVVSAPNPELAREVFARAQRQLTLEPEWKVYFALWVVGIDGRAGTAIDDDARRVLEDHARARAWWGRLAKFGVGQLPYEELLAEASSVGQKAEAHFYEAMRRLTTGDRQGADSLFERVIGTEMVSFYEFLMARELMSPSTKSGVSAR